MLVIPLFVAVAIAADGSEPNLPPVEDRPQVTYEIRFATAEGGDIAKLTELKWRDVRVASSAVADGEDAAASGPPSSTPGLTKAISNATQATFVTTAVLASPAEQQSVIKKLQSMVRASLMFAPKVTVWQGEKWSVGDVVKRPFVGGKRLDDDQLQVATVSEGVTISGQNIDVERSIVRLSAVLQSVDGMDSVDVPKSIAPNLQLQNPRATCTRVDITEELQDGHTLVIGIHDKKLRGKTRYYVVPTEEEVDHLLLVLVTKRQLAEAE